MTASLFRDFLPQDLYRIQRIQNTAASLMPGLLVEGLKLLLDEVRFLPSWQAVWSGGV